MKNPVHGGPPKAGMASYAFHKTCRHWYRSRCFQSLRFTRVTGTPLAHIQIPENVSGARRSVDGIHSPLPCHSPSLHRAPRERPASRRRRPPRLQRGESCARSAEASWSSFRTSRKHVDSFRVETTWVAATAAVASPGVTSLGSSTAAERLVS